MYELKTFDPPVVAPTPELTYTLNDLVLQMSTPRVPRTDDVVVNISDDGAQTSTHRIPRQPSRRTAAGVLTLRAELYAGAERRDVALGLLAGFLAECGLPSGLGERWLAGAADVLDGGQRLELYVEHDDVVDLVSLELWCNGGRVYGVDDWVGW